MAQSKIRMAKKSPRASAQRMPVFAFLMALLSVLSIVSAGPSHAMEDIRPAGIEQIAAEPGVAAFEASYDAKSHIPPHGAPGHMCIAHCNAHDLTPPPVFMPASLPSDTRTGWLLSSQQAPRPGPAFGLKRPPRV